MGVKRGAAERAPRAVEAGADLRVPAATAARIVGRYRRFSHRSYVRCKLRWDPLFAAVAPLLSASPRRLLDIGCGLGLLGQYLRECGFRGEYLGLDLDAHKIEEARFASQQGELDLEFSNGSAETVPAAFRGDVALLDVLHYLPAAMQRRVLDESAKRVGDGGMIVIRNVLRDRSWRFHATVAEENFSRVLGWMTPVGHFPAREEIESPLRAAGLEVRTRPLWGRTPFNSYLIVGRRASS